MRVAYPIPFVVFDIFENPDGGVGAQSVPDGVLP
jgi:hypothetical protein